MKIGTTFDIDQAQKFGLNYKKALKRVIELNLFPIRIGIKWSRVETKKKRYNWEVYDSIFSILNKFEIPTILQVGMKSPQWPEFYIPDHLDFFTPYIPSFKLSNGSTISENDKVLVEKLFIFFEKAIKRYHNLSNIKWLQIENEPFLPSGPLKSRISEEFLKEEIQYARSITKLPILLTAQGLPTTGIIAEYLKGRYKYKKKLLGYSDLFGLNIFPKIRGKLLNITPYIFKASHSEWKYLEKWHNIVKSSKKSLWITELQAEPWGPKKMDFKNAYSYPTCTPTMVQAYLRRLKKIGFETVLIWGTEFHIACEHLGNSTWIDDVYKVVT